MTYNLLSLHICRVGHGRHVRKPSASVSFILRRLAAKGLIFVQ